MTAENKWKAGRRVEITYLNPEDGLAAYHKELIGEEFITGDRPFRFYTNPYHTYKGIVGEALNRKLGNGIKGGILLVFSNDTKFKYLDVMEEKPKFRIPDLNAVWATILLFISVAAGWGSTILEVEDDKGAFGTAWDAMMAGDMLAGAALFFTVMLFTWFLLTISRWFR